MSINCHWRKFPRMAARKSTPYLLTVFLLISPIPVPKTYVQENLANSVLFVHASDHWKCNGSRVLTSSTDNEQNIVDLLNLRLIGGFRAKIYTISIHQQNNRWTSQPPEEKNCNFSRYSMCMCVKAGLQWHWRHNHILNISTLNLPWD